MSTDKKLNIGRKAYPRFRTDFPEIITKRPIGMSDKEYKEKRKESNFKIEQHLKGKFEHVSIRLTPKLNDRGEVSTPLQYEKLPDNKGRTLIKDL